MVFLIVGYVLSELLYFVVVVILPKVVVILGFCFILWFLIEGINNRREKSNESKI